MEHHKQVLPSPCRAECVVIIGGVAVMVVGARCSVEGNKVVQLWYKQRSFDYVLRYIVEANFVVSNHSNH
jgi:hypothetical protein